MKSDPISIFHRCYSRAFHASAPLPDAGALATADHRGRPSVRFVLLKEANEKGFVFYTNARSRKGGELKANPHASLAFYWDTIGIQVRIEGRIREVSSKEADAYWATRPRESNLSALASRQSQPIRNRRQLLARFMELRRQYKDRDIPRPLHWTGFRIVPSSIEFWKRGNFRLHRRDLFTRSGTQWKHTLLQP